MKKWSGTDQASEVNGSNRSCLMMCARLHSGKTVKDSSAVDIPLAIATFRFYSELAGNLKGVTYETEVNDFSFTRREPIGVCGAIIPWNFPLLMYGMV